MKIKDWITIVGIAITLIVSITNSVITYNLSSREREYEIDNVVMSELLEARSILVTLSVSGEDKIHNQDEFIKDIVSMYNQTHETYKLVKCFLSEKEIEKFDEYVYFVSTAHSKLLQDGSSDTLQNQYLQKMVNFTPELIETINLKIREISLKK